MKTENQTLEKTSLNDLIKEYELLTGKPFIRSNFVNEWLLKNNLTENNLTETDLLNLKNAIINNYKN